MSPTELEQRGREILSLANADLANWRTRWGDPPNNSYFLGGGGILEAIFSLGMTMERVTGNPPEATTLLGLKLVIDLNAPRYDIRLVVPDL